MCLCARVHSSVINVSPLSTTNGNDRTQTNTHKNRGQVHSNSFFLKTQGQATLLIKPFHFGGSLVRLSRFQTGHGWTGGPNESH